MGKSFKTQKKAFQYVTYTIEDEGFDYAFRHYSDFNEVKDERFHELRKAYLAAADELEAYVEKMAGNE